MSSGGADEGSVTILNCNIAEDNSNKINFVNCIIPNLGSSVYTNCLYINSSSGSVIHDCYQNDFTLDDDLNCSLTDEQLKTAGFLGPNGTWVGITGGEVKFSLVTPVAQVVDHSLEVDQVERKLKVTLKLGNK